MDTISAVSAAVTGARHLRVARNGQDAAATWVGDGAGAIVVCDGCGSGASSEVGARLGAQLVIGAIAAALQRGERPSELWPGVRARVTSVLAQLVEAMVGAVPAASSSAVPVARSTSAGGDRAAAIREHFLFTIVAAAVAGGEACAWAIGDGGYAFGESMHVLGPFTGNQPPYLAYDLLGMPAVAHLDARDAVAGSVAVVTDGAAELGLAELTDRAALAHPDGLRRRLAVLARGCERIDWDTRRVIRTPAALQDDGAVAILRWHAERPGDGPNGRCR
jgi:hypothetical protein